MQADALLVGYKRPQLVQLEWNSDDLFRWHSRLHFSWYTAVCGSRPAARRRLACRRDEDSFDRTGRNGRYLPVLGAVCNGSHR